MRHLLTTSLAALTAMAAGVFRGQTDEVVHTIKRVTGTEDVRINASSGRMRAARRLREHKAQWPETVGNNPSRQQLRRHAILKGRQALTIAKAAAMKQHVMGGSAVIRNMLDAEKYLV